MTPKRRQTVVDSIRSFGVKAIFVETSVNPKTTREIAKEGDVVQRRAPAWLVGLAQEVAASDPRFAEVAPFERKTFLRQSPAGRRELFRSRQMSKRRFASGFGRPSFPKNRGRRLPG